VAVPYLAAQRLRPLAVTAAAPQALFADVPALQRFYPGLVFENRYWLLAPALTPPNIIARLHAETGRALADDEVREFFLSHGLSPVASTPAASAAMLKQDIERFAGQIRRGELRLQ
jgi:tripartite-type tricarboxylate transporter receptor subunit TctC